MCSRVASGICTQKVKAKDTLPGFLESLSILFAIEGPDFAYWYSWSLRDAAFSWDKQVYFEFLWAEIVWAERFMHQNQWTEQFMHQNQICKLTSQAISLRGHRGDLERFWITAVTVGRDRGTLVQWVGRSVQCPGPEITGQLALSLFINFSQCMLPAAKYKR